MNGIQIADDQAARVSGLLKAGREESEAYQNAAYCEQTLQYVGLGNVDNTADANKSVSYAATAGAAVDAASINSALTVSTAAPTSTLAAGKLWGVYDA